MTFIVETGVGVANANSYISVTDADTYHTLYNNTDWAGDNTTKEQALIQATRAIDLLYGPRYLSFKKVQSTSPLQYPRMPFYDNNQQLIEYTIPSCLKDAVCETALMFMNGIDIYPMPNIDTNIKVNKVKVGEVEIEKQYAGIQGTTETYTSFRKVDMILYPILRNDKQTTFEIRL